MFDDVFADLNKMISTPLGATYHKQTEAEYYVSEIDDAIEWANGIAGEWNGKLPGRLEDRAMRAQELIEKAQELQDLIKELENM